MTDSRRPKCRGHSIRTTAIGAAILLALAVSPALACPTRADLEGAGITVTYSDGARVDYSLAAPDIVLEVNRFADPASNFWLESLHGIYPLSDGAMLGDLPDRRFVATSRYSAAPDDLPPPRPGLAWSGEVTDIDDRGTELARSAFTLQIGAPRTVHLGECTYTMLPVETLITVDEGGFTAQLDYVPALGIGIQTAGGPLGQLQEFYLPVKIERRTE